MSYTGTPDVRQSPGGEVAGLSSWTVTFDAVSCTVFAKDSVGAVREWCLLANAHYRRLVRSDHLRRQPRRFVANADGTITDTGLVVAPPSHPENMQLKGKWRS